MAAPISLRPRVRGRALTRLLPQPVGRHSMRDGRTVRAQPRRPCPSRAHVRQRGNTPGRSASNPLGCRGRRRWGTCRVWLYQRDLPDDHPETSSAWFARVSRRRANRIPRLVPSSRLRCPRRQERRDHQGKDRLYVGALGQSFDHVDASTWQQRDIAKSRVALSHVRLPDKAAPRCEGPMSGRRRLERLGSETPRWRHRVVRRVMKGAYKVRKTDE
jgi:hypothetical protein